MWGAPLYKVLLPFANKEAALTYGRAKYSRLENPSIDRGERKVKSRTHHVAAEGERHQNLTGKASPYGDTQINRNGFI